ncbi:M28 family peptidase [Alteromonas lipolytica]|uniref:Peptidase M28 domain-containing protein n=1 Tax=Alteromonas lipolytica TaxID=1856405 RepID=A0A1E8FJY9_9ALTE|nr:M28 family peptidase [Alteromonas lipolytica]OFI36257.1 hypothetical protein BFC17_09045 [Alteromonas lipolytica]GGF79181.1 aminopeptidase [Alteromonas lipolytica]
MKLGRIVAIFLLLAPVLGYASEPVWMRDVTVLADDSMEGRAAGSNGSALSRQYIISRYKEIGLLPLHSLDSFTHPFSAENKGKQINGTNIVGKLDGKIERYIVVSAHYDHIGRKGRRIFNGADDNASGVAAMLYLAAQSQAQSRQCHQVFLAPDAEEHGLLGARAFVKAGLLESDTIFVNLNLDMLSQPGGREEVLVSGNLSHPRFNRLIEDIEIASNMPMIATDERRRVGRFPNLSDRRKVSDHAAFAEQGIPFLFLGVGRHNYYHTPRDTVSRIDREFYAKTVDIAWQYLQQLDALCAQH